MSLELQSEIVCPALFACEMAVFDALPARVKHAVNYAPLPTDPLSVARMLRRTGGDIEWTIAAVRQAAGPAWNPRVRRRRG